MATKIDTDLPIADARSGGAACSMTLATVNRVARLLVADEAGLARIHRISNEGVELSSIMHLNVGEAARLDLSETVSMGAAVIARHGKRYGLQFEQAVNCAELLRQLVDEARTSQARPLRLTTGPLPARGRSQHGVHRLEVEDISQRGLKVRNDGGFEVGLRLCVQLPNGLQSRGVVRWTTDLSAGLLLADVLSADDLGAVSRLRGNAI